jgi:CheY-like chemotaxis protein
MKAILRKTVLVVDDELLVRLFLTSLIQEHGYKVRQAASGAGALFMLGNAPHEIDLVLVDLHMPGMSGVEFALHAKRRWPEIPVAVMTAQNPAEVSPAEAPGIPIVSKPFVREALFEVLDALATADHPA